MTTLNIIPTRHIRRTDSGRIANTAWLGFMQSTFDELKTAPWTAAKNDILDTSLPVNDPLNFLSADDRYDAYRQSGNGANSRQVVYAGMACHTIKIPASAASTFVREVSFRVNADKFAVGGIKVAAMLSNTATPPAEWELCRRGGTDSAIDAGGKFATPEIENPDWGTIGILAETSKVRDGSENRTGVFALDLSAETAAWKYLHLVISMFSESAWRYEYFVEGSGMIDPQSIAITFDADGVTPDAPPTPPQPPVPIEMPIALGTLFGNEYMTTVAAPAQGGGLVNPSAPTAIMNLANGTIGEVLDFSTFGAGASVGLLASTPTNFMRNAIVYGYSSVAVGKKITGIKFPFAIYRPRLFKFRLAAYFINTPNLFGGLSNAKLHPDEYKDINLWLGRKASLKFLPITLTENIPAVCAYNEAMDVRFNGGGLLPFPSGAKMGYVPENPFLGVIFLLSIDSVTPPAEPYDSVDYMSWVSSGIVSGAVIQEP